MADFTISKDTTVKAVKDATKAEVMQVIFDALVEKYGEGNVGTVRTGNGQSKKNELAVRAKTVEFDGEDLPVCVKITGAAAEIVDRKTDKREFFAFNFDEARQAYEDYLNEKAEKEAIKESNKQKKIEKDKAARAKKATDIEF